MNLETMQPDQFVFLMAATAIALGLGIGIPLLFFNFGSIVDMLLPPRRPGRGGTLVRKLPRRDATTRMYREPAQPQAPVQPSRAPLVVLKPLRVQQSDTEDLSFVPLNPEPTAAPEVVLNAPEPAVEDGHMPATEWVPLLFNVSAHVVILGGSGAGKTRSAKAFVRHIVEVRKERVIVLDPKANLDTWMGIPAITEPQVMSIKMAEILKEFRARLDQNSKLTEEQADAAFERFWVIVDEISFVRDCCDIWITFLRRISSMARSLKIHLVVINQSANVKELGLKDRGDLLANFTKVRLTRRGWTGAPARIDFDGEIVLGAWNTYFPNAYRGAKLPETGVYQTLPLNNDEMSRLILDEADEPGAEMATRTLELLKSWDWKRGKPSVNAVRKALRVHNDKAKDALLLLLKRGMITEEYRPIETGEELEEPEEV